MKVWRSLENIQLTSSACAIGMFDGVHVGHQMVLENALRESRLYGVESVIFSFANHPQFLISQSPTQLLSTLEERLAAFERLGFDHALILDFDDALKSLTAQDFVQQILIDRLAVKSVTVGYDHRFGKQRQGDGAFLTQCGLAYGFDVQIIDPVRVNDQIVSSTLIRKLLSYGELEQANILLGKPYPVCGRVEAGLQRGRQLGFPTANLCLEPHRLIPAIATYGGVSLLEGQRYPAVCNVGLSPTFGDQTTKRVEVHLLGYNGELFYDKDLTFEFHQTLRSEEKFNSVQALIDQIQKDCQQVSLQWELQQYLKPQP